MIQANEAIVGRWFSRKHGKGHTWTRLDERIVGMIFSDSNEYALDDFDPIPLTPKILEIVGFVKKSIDNPFFNIYDLLLSRGRHISVSGVGTPNEMVFFNHKGKPYEIDCVPVRNYDYDGKTHLHHIQNICFDFTGTELSVNF